MTTLSRKQLLTDLEDKETRELFAEEHIATGLRFQLHGLREKLGLTQAQLGTRAGMAQERISVLEDPNSEFLPKISTLIKLANVFDVPLIVKFGTWQELLDWNTELSPERIAPQTFPEELSQLGQVTATPAWNQGRVSNIAYVSVGNWIDANVAETLPFTVRAFDQSRIGWKQIAAYRFRGSSGLGVLGPDVYEDMPVIDYTEEAGEGFIQTTTMGAYCFPLVKFHKGQSYPN